MIDITPHVPFGQDNALSSRVIAAATDCVSEADVQHTLNRLAESGAIKRCQQKTVGIAFRWIYWREGAAA